MMFLLMTLVFAFSGGQILIENEQCPAKIGQQIDEISDDYVTTYLEIQRLLEEREEIKKKYEKQIKEIEDEYNPTVEKLIRENSRLAGMVNKDVNHVIDCKWYHNKDPSLKSGVYELSVGGVEFPAYCEMDFNGGGWTVLFRRYRQFPFDGNQTWQTYKNGFGDMEKNYFIGNEKIHVLTKGRVSDTIIVGYIRGGYLLENQLLKNFSVLSEKNKYKCTFKRIYSDNLLRTPNLIPNNGVFLTYDKDTVDKKPRCASRVGGWWQKGECWVTPTYKDFYLSNFTMLIRSA